MPGFEALVRVLDHHHRGIHHRADRDGDAAERHDVGVDPLVDHDDERRENAERQRDDRDESRAQVKQEQHAHQRHNDELLDEFLPEVRHGALDEAGPVVGGHNLDAGRQARFERRDLRLDRVDRFQRVLAPPHHDDAARDLALAVELRDAAAHFRPDLQARDVAEAHRNPRIARRKPNLVEIVERFQITARAHHVLRFAQFEHRAAGLLVGALHRLDHFRVRDIERPQPRGVEHDLVLLHHTADARDFRDVRHGLQLVLEEPVLQRTQLRQVHAAAAIDERVLVDPADTGRVGSERGLRLGGEPRLHLVQVFEHPRARPVRVGAVLEEDVHERIAEERIAAHGLRSGHREHRRGERISDLVLDDLRRLPRVGGADDHLHVGEVGNRVERRPRRRPDSPRRECERGEHHEETVRDRPADELRDHLRTPYSGTLASAGAMSVIWNSPFGLMLNSKRIRSPFFNPSGTIPFGARNGMVIAPMPALGIAPCLMSRSPAPVLTTSPTARCVCGAAAFGASAPSMRVPDALKLASESMRNWPETTTLSPSESPLRISLLPPDSKPSSTSCGQNLPSLSATMTTLRSPVRMTASDGTRSAFVPVPCAKTSVANMPGFSLPPGLASSTRARSVRVAAFTSGRIALTRPRKTWPGKPGTRASTAVSERNHAPCASATSALTHTLERSTRRNSIAPDITVMPSRTPSSAMMPMNGAWSVMSVCGW